MSRLKEIKPDHMITQKQCQELIKRVENGEHIGIVNENGAACVMMSTDDELYKMYIDHEEGS